MNGWEVHKTFEHGERKLEIKKILDQQHGCWWLQVFEGNRPVSATAPNPPTTGWVSQDDDNLSGQIEAVAAALEDDFKRCY